MLQQPPNNEEKWMTHVLNIHSTPFEQLCQHDLRQSPDWTFKSSRYPVEFPSSYSPLVSQTKNSKLDLWGTCKMPYRFLCNDVQREGVKARSGLAPGLSAMCHYTTFSMASIITA